MARRGRGEGTLRKRIGGLWEARAIVGRKPDGTPIRKSFYGKTRQEAAKKLSKTIYETQTGTYMEPSKMTTGQWLDIWLNDYKRHAVKPTTFLAYQSRIETGIKPFIGGIRLKDLQTDAVQSMVNELTKQKKNPSTIRGIFLVLNGALKQAKRNGLLAKNPADGVLLPSAGNRAVEIMNPEEQRRFMAAAKKARHGGLFLLMLGTGLRIGEALALHWGAVDLDKGFLEVRMTLNCVRNDSGQWIKTFGSPKTQGSYRIIPLMESTLEQLQALKHKQNPNQEGLLFCTKKGTPLDPRNMQKAFQSIAAEAEITKRLTIHSLRHTFATRGLESGIALKVMQELLGHANIKMTADIYTHVSTDKKRTDIQKIAAAFF